MSNRPLNVGLVGGGKGAFIVHPHQKAIHFDGTRRVVAGAAAPLGGDMKFLSDEQLKKWIDFLRACGGFEVW